MKAGVTLETERLIIRHWTLSEEDRAFFHFINSNETGRKFYASRLSRECCDEILENLVPSLTGDAFDWALACRKDTGQRLGFTGLARVGYETPFTPAVEIGWQYDPAVWGNGYATEAGTELLRHGFEDLHLDEIVAFAVHNNHPSIAIMERIGMNKVEGGDFDHPKVIDETHTHLKRHVLWRINAEEWNEKTR